MKYNFIRMQKKIVKYLDSNKVTNCETSNSY